MRLTAKLMLSFIFGITLVLAAYGAIRVRREIALFDTDMARDAVALGHAVRDLVERVWSLAGEREALAELADLNRRKQSVAVRWVWLTQGPEETDPPLAPFALLGPLANGQDISLRLRRPDGAEVRATYVPLRVGSAPAALELTESLESMREYIRTTIIRTAAVCGGAILLCATGAMFLGYYLVARPLGQLITKTTLIGQGDLSGDITLHRRDELNDLGNALNTMCAELAAALARERREADAKAAALDQLRHADRLKTVGRLASGVAHEIGTPLNVILGRAEMIAKRVSTDDLAVECAAAIRAQTKRIANIIRSLLDFSRQSVPQKRQVDLNELIAGTVEFIAPLAAKRTIVVTFRPAESPVLTQVDYDQIQHVLSNLIMNAVDASPERSQVEVAVGHCRRTEEKLDENTGDGVCVTVRDHGAGISPDAVPHIFEPFFTTKDVGEGTGLGLSIAYGIVEEHGGRIGVDTELGRGSCFSVYLPA